MALKLSVDAELNPDYLSQGSVVLFGETNGC